MSDPTECSICVEPMALPCKLSTCGHTLCMTCILRLGSQRVSCPICRKVSGTVLTPISHRDFWDVCKARRAAEVLDSDDMTWENFRRMYEMLARQKRLHALEFNTQIPVERMRRVCDLSQDTRMTETLEQYERTRIQATDEAKRLRASAKIQDERARRAKMQLDTYFASVP